MSISLPFRTCVFAVRRWGMKNVEGPETKTAAVVVVVVVVRLDVFKCIELFLLVMEALKMWV